MGDADPRRRLCFAGEIRQDHRPGRPHQRGARRPEGPGTVDAVSRSIERALARKRVGVKVGITEAMFDEAQPRPGTLSATMAEDGH